MIKNKLLSKFSLLFQKANRFLRTLRDLILIWSSHLFDRKFYLKNNPDVKRTGLSPALHFLRCGGFEGRDPGPSFSTAWYLGAYEDAKKSGANPLIHYIREGRKKGYTPVSIEENLALIRESGMFNELWYLALNPDVAQSGMDAAAHYLLFGGYEGRDPCPSFHSRWYLDAYKDVERSGINPLVHYLRYGRKTGREKGCEKGHEAVTFQLHRMYDYSKQAGCIVFEDISERVYLQPPRVIGNYSCELNEGEALCPPAYVSVIENAVIFGGSSLVIAQQKFILSDEMVDFNSDEIGIKSPLVKIRHENTVLLEYKKETDFHIKEGILLSCDHDNNYFHWLIECLPKVMLLDALLEFKEVPLLIPRGLHKNLEEALQRANINKRSLIYLEPNSAYQIERVIYPSALSRIIDRYQGSPIFNVDIVLSHKWISKVGRLLRGNIKDYEKPWRKLYLARRKGLRILKNEDRLETVLLKEGFEIVELDSVTLGDQISLFSQVALVVAPSGAALTNMLFCQPGTNVIILMSNHETTNFYFWSNLGAINNLNITIIAGERVFRLTDYWSVHDDYLIDTNLVLETIRNNGLTMDKKHGGTKKSSDVLVEEGTLEDIKNSTKIFVVGPPRSGTTLIYSMIAQDLFLPEATFVSSLMKFFDETYKFSDKERFEYYAHDLQNLVRIFKKPIYDFLYSGTLKVGGISEKRFIYKDPMLTLYLEYFPLFFDDSYKVVFCVRDPRDTVSSMFQVLKKQNPKKNSRVLFDEAVDFIFKFYKSIQQINNKTVNIAKDKIIFIKYEEIVLGDHEAVRALEGFLGFAINSQGMNITINDKIDRTSPFYSENYGNAITVNPIGKYKNILTSEQVAKIENIYSFYMEKFNYRSSPNKKAPFPSFRRR